MGLTIYDIAREAKTSVSTVSRYINNKKIQPENKAKIEAVLKTHNFKPNAMARGLVSKSMKTVGVITLDIRVPHYATTAYTFEQEFTKKGYSVIICNSSGDINQTIDYIKNLLSKHVDGIAFIGSTFSELNNSEEVKNLLEDVPVVVANGYINSNNSHFVSAKDGYSSEIAIDYFVQKGRKDIYFVKDTCTESSNRKVDGFFMAMQKHNLDCMNKILYAEHSLYGGQEAVEYLLKHALKFDALLCAEDIVAVGALNALREKGFEVGKDVDVIGFNNTVYSEITLPKLTVIDNKPEEQARLLVKILEQVFEKDDSVKNLSIEPELLIKGSA